MNKLDALSIIMSSLIHSIMESLTQWGVLANIGAGETDINVASLRIQQWLLRLVQKQFPPYYLDRVEWLFSRSATLLTKFGDKWSFMIIPEVCP